MGNAPVLNPSLLNPPPLPDYKDKERQFPWIKEAKSACQLARIATEGNGAYPKKPCAKVTHHGKPDLTSKVKNIDIPPLLFGNVVEFLTARRILGKEKAEVLYTAQAMKNLKKGENEATQQADLMRLSAYLDAIDADPRSQRGIEAAVRFVSFDSTSAGSTKKYVNQRCGKTISIDTLRLACQLTDRTVSFFSGQGQMQAYEFAIPMDVLDEKRVCNGARFDFVVNNQIWDLKTTVRPVCTENMMQTLIYLALIQHVETKNPVTTSAIYNPINDTSYEFVLADVMRADPDLMPYIAGLLGY